MNVPGHVVCQPPPCALTGRLDPTNVSSQLIALGLAGLTNVCMGLMLMQHPIHPRLIALALLHQLLSQLMMWMGFETESRMGM